MFRPRVIPCLLLKGKGVVKTIKFEEPRYIGDPINVVKIFNDLEADELVFLDIEASKENRLISLDFVKKIGEEAFMPFAVGGGIKTTDEIKSIFNSGAEKVIISTHAIENPGLVKKASEFFGSQSIVVCIDVKKNSKGIYEVHTLNGSNSTGFDPVDVAKKMESAGAGELIITSIDNDGVMGGYDLELVKSVSDAVNIPVIASGGAGNEVDLKKAFEFGASGVSGGSIFVYSGKNRGILVNYPDKGELLEIFK